MLARGFSKIIKNIPSVKFVEDPKPVGRWATNCNVGSNIRSALANLDSCGDRLCGDPLEATKAITHERRISKKATRE